MNAKVERFLNPMIRTAPEDVTIPIFDRAEQLEREGTRVIHMDLGRPDFDTPQRVKEAAIEALRQGKVHYTSLNGIPELKDAIARREWEEHGVRVDPEREVMVTVGASEALFHIWLNFLGPGDEILMPTPCYCAYLYLIACLGAKAVEVPMIREGQAAFDIREFERKITPRTKLFLLNSPGNPSGYVFDRTELSQIAELAIRHDLLVISDECYDHYLFSGEHVSIASLPGMKERTITVNSTSKTFSMTGWRVGYAMGAADLLEPLEVSHGNLILCAPSFAQYGAVEAFDGVKSELKGMREEFRKRRDCVVEAMREIGCLPFVEPRGAFYLFFDVSPLGMNGMEFCVKFLEEYQVTGSPGEVYGRDYSDYVRLAYTCCLDDVREAMKRLKEMVRKWN